MDFSKIPTDSDRFKLMDGEWHFLTFAISNAPSIKYQNINKMLKSVELHYCIGYEYETITHQDMKNAARCYWEDKVIELESDCGLLIKDMKEKGTSKDNLIKKAKENAKYWKEWRPQNDK